MCGNVCGRGLREDELTGRREDGRQVRVEVSRTSARVPPPAMASSLIPKVYELSGPERIRRWTLKASLTVHAVMLTMSATGAWA